MRLMRVKHAHHHLAARRISRVNGSHKDHNGNEARRFEKEERIEGMGIREGSRVGQY